MEVLGRAVAVGHVLGAAAGLRETDRLREVLGDRHRWHAVRGHLHELGGDLPAAAAAYAGAARRATNIAKRDHLVRQRPRAGRRAIQPTHPTRVGPSNGGRTCCRARKEVEGGASHAHVPGDKAVQRRLRDDREGDH